MESALGVLDSSQLASRTSSENAAMMRRKITGDKLSPCLTPTPCEMSAFSFPILSVTTRLE